MNTFKKQSRQYLIRKAYRERIGKLKQDLLDMYSNTHGINFIRCKKCKHLHSSVHRCNFCGHDNSFEG